MRRLFSIVTIAIAVFTVMTSAIVPHHHHGDVVCIAVHHCDHDCIDDDHDCENGSSDCSNHHHDNKNCPFDYSCVAKASYVVSHQTEIKHKIHLPDNGHNNNNVYFAPIFLFSANFYDAEAKYFYLSKHRYKEKDFLQESGNANHINGLRAPPYFVA